MRDPRRASGSAPAAPAPARAPQRGHCNSPASDGEGETYCCVPSAAHGPQLAACRLTKFRATAPDGHPVPGLQPPPRSPRAARRGRRGKRSHCSSEPAEPSPFPAGGLPARSDPPPPAFPPRRQAAAGRRRAAIPGTAALTLRLPRERAGQRLPGVSWSARSRLRKGRETAWEITWNFS